MSLKDSQSSIQNIEDLYFESGTLTITVHGAVIYSKMDSSKAYCVITTNDPKLFSDKGVSETVPHYGSPIWNFTWKSDIFSLGTQKSPTTIRIEVFGSKLFKDDFIGQVLLPIIGFADTNVYELKLPLLQREGVQWSEDLYQGELELTIHFSEDVSKLMTELEIENLYRNMKLLRPETPRVATTAEKWKVLKQLSHENSKLEEEHTRKNRPERYAKHLKSLKMNKVRWEKLSRNLVETDWQNEFITQFYGIESVLYHLSILHFKISIYYY
jgi:hypothetical protein